MITEPNYFQLVGIAYVDLGIPSPWGPNLEILIQ